MTLTAYHNQYIKFGFHIFPIRPLGKEPIGQLVPNGLHDATDDPTIIAQWWSTWPDANIGIRTGVPSGIVVMDGDDWDSVDRLEEEHGPVPVTPTAKTGGGGVHAYFKHPGGAIPNSRGQIAPGVDLRADGGYVVAPPSSHASGGSYEWVKGFSPDDVPLAESPLWLFASPRRESPRLRDDEMITAGGRNDRLMRIGAAFRRYGLTESELAAALHVVNKTRCRPPLDEAEVGRIAASVARYEPGKVLTHKRKGVRLVGGKVVHA